MKNIIVALVGLLCSAAVWAQAPDAGAVRTKIREVKLSERYVYSEGMSKVSAEEAAESAILGLQTEANRILSEMGKEKAEKAPILKLVDEKRVMLTYQMGTIHKAFVYVPMSLVTGVEPEGAEEVSADATPVAAQPEQQPVVEQPVVEQPKREPVIEQPNQLPVAEEPKQQPVVEQPVVEQPAEPVPAVVPQPEPVATKDSVQVVDPVSEPTPVLEMVPTAEEKPDSVKQAELAHNMGLSQKPLEEQKQAQQGNTPDREYRVDTSIKETMIKLMDMAEMKTKTPPPVPNLTKEPSPLDTTNPATYQVLSTLLSLDTYEGVMLYLDGMKDDGRVMYGKLGALRNPEKVYFIIVKDGKLVTVLNKGGRERVNLKTNQPDLITNYIGYGVIWLLIF